MAADLFKDLTSVFAPSIVVGVLSAGANVVEKQARQKKEAGATNANGTNANGLFQNASLWGDVAIGGYAVINYMNPQGFFPTDKDAKLAMAGAGIALLSRRAADYIGAAVLKLPTGAGNRYTAIPGRSMNRGGRPSLRSPGAAVETAVLPRKRQFFSVT